MDRLPSTEWDLRLARVVQTLMLSDIHSQRVHSLAALFEPQKHGPEVPRDPGVVLVDRDEHVSIEEKIAAAKFEAGDVPAHFPIKAADAIATNSRSDRLPTNADNVPDDAAAVHAGSI
jgi:hypothetical protein